MNTDAYGVGVWHWVKQIFTMRDFKRIVRFE